MKYVTPEVQLISMQTKDIVTFSLQELGYGDAVSWGSGTMKELE